MAGKRDLHNTKKQCCQKKVDDGQKVIKHTGVKVINILSEDVNEVHTTNQPHDHCNFNTGHRKRLRERFARSALHALPDYEILEMLLFLVFRQSDTKALSKSLLSKFGSLGGVIAADATGLKMIEGIGDAVVNHFKLLQDVFSRLMLPTRNEKVNVLNNWLAVLHYCQFTTGFKKKEYFRVLFLNKKNLLVADELFDSGTVDKVAIYPREIAKQALMHYASAVILVHNHPSGDVNPSKEDIEITKKICFALKAVNVSLHDHLIVSKDNHFSFRGHNLLDEEA
jgi:DNA repair protein RadC